MDGIVTHAPGDAIAYPNHVRSIGIVIAPRRYRNMARKPRGWSGQPISSECISIMHEGTPDETRTLFVSKRTATNNVAGVVRRTSKVSHAATYEAMLAQVGAVGNID